MSYWKIDPIWHPYVMLLENIAWYIDLICSAELLCLIFYIIPFALLSLGSSIVIFADPSCRYLPRYLMLFDGKSFILIFILLKAIHVFGFLKNISSVFYLVRDIIFASSHIFFRSVFTCFCSCLRLLLIFNKFGQSWSFYIHKKQTN